MCFTSFDTADSLFCVCWIKKAYYKRITLSERKIAELEHNFSMLLKVINKTASQHQSS